MKKIHWKVENFHEVGTLFSGNKMLTLLYLEMTWKVFFVERVIVNFDF